MSWQCTFCDIKADDFDDPIFDECKRRRHEIMNFSSNNARKISKKNTNSNKTILKKVKGRINDYYVESILVDDTPNFLCYSFSDNSVSIKTSIEVEKQVYQPIEADHCGYFPYSYTLSEITELIKVKISKESLLDNIKSEIDRFISLSEFGKHLILGDVLLTYCQEWISTLHYPFFVGETESGKSSVLHLVNWLGYRCMLGEDVPLADVYNFLGSEEEGCGTIVEDEAQDLWKNSEKVRTYKSSYAKGSKKARIVGADSLGKHQVFYKTFCPKWFAAEKLPLDKGLLERLAVVHMTEGKPQRNIKRLTEEEKQNLNRIRNMLLVWKLQNIKSGIERIDSGLTQRDQELWEDYLIVVSGTRYFEYCKNVVAFYVKQRHDAIRHSLEARVFALVLDKMDIALEVNFTDLWNHLRSNLPGELDRNTFHPEEYPNKITYYSLSKLLEDKFQAKKKQWRDNKEQKTSYQFKKDAVKSLTQKYGIDLPLDHPIYLGTDGTHGSSASSEPSEPSSEDQVKEDPN